MTKNITALSKVSMFDSCKIKALQAPMHMYSLQLKAGLLLFRRDSNVVV